jgi:hypothetical protein
LIQPLIKEGKFIAQVVLDSKYNPSKWKNLFTSVSQSNEDEKLERIILRPGTPLSEIDLPSPMGQETGVLNLPYY